MIWGEICAWTRVRWQWRWSRNGKTYRRQLGSFLEEHEGEYVLIRDQVEGFWKTDQEADEAGRERFGLIELWCARRSRKSRALS